MLTKLTRHIFYENFDGIKRKAGGLTEFHKPDERDLGYEQLGGLLVPYQPKHKEHVIQTLDVKDQGIRNTCSFNAYATMREITERKVLSVRSFVAYARSNGLLTKDGFSTLANNNKAGTDFGIAEEELLRDDPNMNWEDYSSLTLLTEKIRENAKTHRADYRKTFYCRTIDEILKALDDGYIIEYGYDWYSSYNMSGKFSAPWILPWRTGVKVGGHATDGKGYKDLVWKGNRVIGGLLHCQNSYSKRWGLDGDFFVKFSDLMREGIVGMVSVDMDEANILELIKSYEGKFIKHAFSSGIWKIEEGKKRPFPDDFIYAAFGGRVGKNKNYQPVARSVIEQIPDGNPMDVRESPLWNVIEPNWEVLSHLRNPDNFKRLTEIIKEHKQASEWLNPSGVGQTLWEKIMSLFK